MEKKKLKILAEWYYNRIIKTPKSFDYPHGCMTLVDIPETHYCMDKQDNPETWEDIEGKHCNIEHFNPHKYCDQLEELELKMIKEAGIKRKEIIYDEKITIANYYTDSDDFILGGISKQKIEIEARLNAIYGYVKHL